ncbi:hypothetical protein J8J40_26815, partial [Mycobacterium tuberculosis]|nr:hypothetical protein [Mycobacterium tuberculosis]
AFERAVGSVVGTISTAATQLHATAQVLTSNAEGVAGRSGQASVAARSASENVVTVASATEELNASIGEIARQVSTSSAMSDAAVKETAATAE